jgi:hypothetical protein
MMVQSMTLDCVDVIPLLLWSQAYYMAVYIKNCLLDSTFELHKLRYEIIFWNKPSLKHLYPLGKILGPYT